MDAEKFLNSKSDGIRYANYTEKEVIELLDEFAYKYFNDFISQYPIKIKQRIGRIINNKIDINQLKLDFKKFNKNK